MSEEGNVIILDPEKKEKLSSNEWNYIGEYYWDYGTWGLLYAPQTSFSRRECEDNGLLWIEGVCFDIDANNVEVDYYREKRVSDGVIIYNYFYRIKS